MDIVHIKKRKKKINITYLVEWVDSSEPNVLFRNPSIRVEDCKERAKRKCRHCYGRGFQLWDQGKRSQFLFKIACPCVQRHIEKNGYPVHPEVDEKDVQDWANANWDDV